MKNPHNRFALIYLKATNNRHIVVDRILDQQERCIKYAREHGYNISHIFIDSPDRSDSGRSTYKLMLAYIKNNPSERFVVIATDLSRLTRDVSVLKQIVKDFSKLNVRLETVESNNFLFNTRSI